MSKDTYPMFVADWALEEVVREVVREAVQMQAGEAVDLPAPRTQGGPPLFDALRERQSRRDYNSDALPLSLLSDLLWCAFGVNRPAGGGRTAPSAENWQEIDIYVARSDGLLLFEPTSHSLVPVSRRDLRALTGLQPYVATAALDLVYVADFDRATDATEDEKRMYCPANVGFIAQNVYLFCASQGLGTSVRGAIDRKLLAAAMGLRRQQHVILAQSVGYCAGEGQLTAG